MSFSSLIGGQSGIPYSRVSVFFWLCLFPILTVGGSEPLVLGDGSAYHLEGRHMELLEDREGKLTFEDVLTKDLPFVQLEERIPNLGAVRSQFWVRFTVVNPDHEARLWIMSFELPHFAGIYTHVPSGDGGYRVVKRGLFEARPGNPVKHPHHVAEVMTPAESTNVWYVQLISTGPTQIPIRFQTRERFIERERKANGFYGFYLGGVLIMILYNLFLYWGAGEKVYIFYCLFLMSSGLVWMSSKGLVFIYLWPENRILAGLDLVAFCLFALLSGSVFSMSFLKTRSYCPTIHKLLIFGIAGIGLSGFLYVFSMAFSIVFMAVLGSFCMLLFFTAGVISWKNGYKPARYFVVSWIPIVLVSTQLALEKGGFIPRLFMDQFFGMGGSMLEMILISFALADRINTVKRQREEAQKKAMEAQTALNRDLEMLVERRTRDLDEALDVQTSQNKALAQKHEQLEQAQERMIRQASMASMGTLSAGVAHELRNPLNFINNFSQVMTDLSAEAVRMAPETNQDLKDILEDLNENAGLVSKYGERADRIVKAMVEWAGKGGERRVVNFNRFVERCLKVSTYGPETEAVNIEYEWGPDMDRIELSPQQFSRVVTQLAANAVEAVLARLEKEDGLYQPCVKIKTFCNEQGTHLLVWDNGVGIPEDNLNQVFTPFFTTKHHDARHVGLGLSMAYDAIVKHHHGTVSLESKPNQFTRVLVSLSFEKPATSAV